MFRRALSCMTMLFLLLSIGLTARPASADSTDVQVLFGGEPVVFEVPPLIRDGRTFVPVRFVLERIEAKLEWDGVKRQVTILYGDTTVILTIDSRTVLVNGEETEIDVAPFIFRDRTMVPLRFVGEKFGFNVQWDPVIRTVLLVPPATRPVAATPAPAKPAPTTPTTPTQPAQPAPTNPTPTKPAPTNPTPTTPPPTNPTPTNPPPTNPTPTNPPPTNPTPTNPTPTDPNPTQPEPVQPKPTLSIAAPATVTMATESFDVDVMLKDVADVAGAVVAITFDPARVQVIDIQRGSTVNGMVYRSVFDNQKGRVEFGAVNLGTTFTGEGLLVRVRFKPRSLGNVTFAIASGSPTGGGALSVKDPLAPVARGLQPAFVFGMTTIMN